MAMKAAGTIMKPARIDTVRSAPPIHMTLVVSFSFFDR